MNRFTYSAGIFVFLGAAILCACGMPPIPQTQNPDLSPAGDIQDVPGLELEAPPPQILTENEVDDTALEAELIREPSLQDSEEDFSEAQTDEGEWADLQATQAAAAEGTAIALTATATAEVRPAVDRPNTEATPGQKGTPQPDPARPTSSVDQPASEGLADCAEKGPGREKVRVVNKTGEGAVLYLYGPENYACSIEPGTQRIYIRGGVYNLSSLMCGGQLFDLGNNVINPTWFITLRCP